MGIGRIASFLSSLSPGSDAAAATSAAEPAVADTHRQAEETAAYQDRERREPQGGLTDITMQLQTMIAAVRSSNEVAVQQGAAVAVSPAGMQLKSAVTGLAHILAVVDARALASGAAPQVREASQVVDAVEAGLVGSQAAAQGILGQLPPQQAAAARQAAERFQAEMNRALVQVRGVLEALQRLA